MFPENDDEEDHENQEYLHHIYYRAFDKKLISVEQHLKLNEMLELEKNKIGAMMNYLINCEIKGLKFK